MAFIDEHREVFGVEPICEVLREHGVGIAPSTYRAVKHRPPSARAVRDEELKVEIQRVYDENFVVFGARKIWDQLNEENITVAQCTIRRLMNEIGLSGVHRGRSWVRTTISDGATERPSDLVERNFTADAPNRLWVADLTYVKTHTDVLQDHNPRFGGRDTHVGGAGGVERTSRA